MLSVPPVRRLSAHSLPPEVARRIVHDEVMLDGNARQNLATFVTTWMEPEGAAVMAECRDKNLIDKDEYPRTAEIERRCVAILADLWHAPTRTGRWAVPPPGRARRACSRGWR